MINKKENCYTGFQEWNRYDKNKAYVRFELKLTKEEFDLLKEILK